MKIRSQIMATLGLVTLLPTAALVLVSHERTAAEIRQRVDRGMQALAERTAAHLDGYLTSLLEEVRAMATIPAMRACLGGEPPAHQRAVARDLLTNLLERDPVNSIACGLLDVRGKVLFDSLVTAVDGDEGSQPYFKTTIAGSLPWAGHCDWPDSPFPVLVIASAVRDSNGKVLGVLRLVMETACLQHQLANTDVAIDASNLVLLDENGRVIADARSPERRFGSARLTNLVKEQATTDCESVLWFPAGANRTTAGFAVTTPIGRLPWRLMVWQPANSYREPVDQLLQQTMLQSCVAGILLLLAAAVASRLVAGPIQKLEQSAQSIADGNLDIAIPIGSDEIGTLGRTLQLMKDRLLATMASLQDAAADATVASQVKSQFLANMSHELRTPMTAIIGYTEVILEDPSLTAEPREQAATILRNARHLLDLVNEVLDLAKVESGTMEMDLVDFSPTDVFHDVVDLLQIRARDKGIALKLDAPTLPARLRSDQHRLRQILLNLVGNAIKFTDTGSVSLRARITAKPTTLVCEVADTGAGIAPERVADLFQPFAQVDTSMSRRHGGTGLGLAISRRIAGMLGGDITVQSTLGSGSTFTLTVPVEVRKAEMAKPSQRTGTTAKLHGRILLVEDGRDNQKLFAHIMKKAGAEVLVAENGLDGIAALSIGSDPDAGLLDPLPCDLVLMDMQMPVLDGYSATKRLRELGLRIPVVALTA
ncbi:MAG: ATP-binding protein, partial [Planctomycetota bacterium]|nr:ATP-binding protein [Planctomycetota bacterium]